MSAEDSKQGTERSGVTEVRIRSRALRTVRSLAVLLANTTMTASERERYSIDIEGGRSFKTVPEPNTEQIKAEQFPREHWTSRFGTAEGVIEQFTYLVG